VSYTHFEKVKLNILWPQTKNLILTLSQLFVISNKKSNFNFITIDVNRPDICHLQSPMILVLAGYVNYIFLFVVSWIGEFFFGSGPNGSKQSTAEEINRDGYAPLFSRLGITNKLMCCNVPKILNFSFEKFYIRNVYRRMKNVVNHPIASVPGATIEIIKRESSDNFWYI